MDDKKKPYKALVSAGGTVVAFVFSAWLADTDPFTAKEIGEAIFGGLLAGGVVGGATYGIKNPRATHGQ